MKVTFVSLLALASSFTTVISTPLAEPATLAKRVDPESLVTSLFATVQSHTKIINSTTDTLSPSSSAEEKAAAGEIFTAQLAAINAAVVDATNSLSKRSFDLEERQLPNPAALAGLVVNLLLDISGALNNIIADLGLSKCLIPSIQVRKFGI
ncbi:MAG: hypothetical protein LQ351_004998 [Letrouitia transgressa]|nr:MAG: hypothetical protein LQ351_004998 [Letrouitia transgressa]